MTASSERPGHPATEAFDANAATYWASEGTGPQWLQVDLGFPRGLGRVEVNWGDAFATSWLIQLSVDGAEWITAASETGGDGWGMTSFIRGTARYVRIAPTVPATADGYQIEEFRVYGSSCPTPTPTIAAQRTTGHPSVQASRFIASLPVVGVRSSL